VHNHGITFHRNLRSKGTFKNELEQIKGIGNTTADMLLKEFKSVKNIKLQTADILTALIGKAKTKILTDYFTKE
jgi:excinuclease ABC subunit C